MPTLALLFSLAPQQLAPFPATPFDRVIPITIDEHDVLLSDHGHAKRSTYKAGFSGTLHLWTRSAADLDLLLRVETPQGDLVTTDDNSGGGKTPYAVLDVESGRELVIVVAVAGKEGLGSLELCALAAPETEQTRAASEMATVAIADVTRMRESGRAGDGRKLAQETLKACRTVPAGPSSELLAARMWDLGYETNRLSVLQLSEAAFRHTLSHRLRTLPEEHADLQRARLNLAVVLEALGDVRQARGLNERVLEIYSRTLPEEHSDLQRVRLNLAATMYSMGDLTSARSALERVHEIYERTLPDEHPDLQTARGSLAETMRALGDLPGARALFERMLEVYLRTLPEAHPDVRMARAGLAALLHGLGDLQGARELQERVLEVCSQTLPEEHPDLQAARRKLAATIAAQGDFKGARALDERILEVCMRTLPETHPDLQSARLNLAVTVKALGDLQRARSLEERVLEVYSRTVPEEHPDLQVARLNLAGTMNSLGELQRARVLEEQALDVYSRTLPEGHSSIQAARLNLAGTLHRMGDLQGARDHFERVLAVYSRTLPDDHADVQKARQGLAATVAVLGDMPAARSLLARALEVLSRTLPEEHPELQAARVNLAMASKDLGDLQGAHMLLERVLEILSRTLPEDHPDLQAARGNLAVTIRELGDSTRARTLQERVLEVFLRTLPEDHPDLQRARSGLAVTLRHLGSLQEARELQERVFQVYSRTLPEEHLDLDRARLNLAVTNIEIASRRMKPPGNMHGTKGDMDDAEGRGAALLAESSYNRARIARMVRLNSPGREAEARCASLADHLGITLSVALGYGGLDPCASLQLPAFMHSESTRNAAVSSSALGRRAAMAEGYSEARARLRQATDDLARLVHAGTNSEGYRTALSEREAAESSILDLGRRTSGGKPVSLDLETLRSALKHGEAAVAYRSYTRFDLRWPEEADAVGRAAPELTAVESLCAFIASPHTPAAGSVSAPPLALIDLGPIAPISDAIGAWRNAMDAGAGRGVRVSTRSANAAAAAHAVHIRRLVFDPLRRALGDANHVVVVLDGPLQLVPLDALPVGDDEAQRLGDTIRIDIRATLGELLDTPLPLRGERVLVGLGGVEFDHERVEVGLSGGAHASSTLVRASAEPTPGYALPSLLRGGSFGTGFESLPGTLQELEGLEDEFAKSIGTHGTFILLRDVAATKQALLTSAPRARWLHIATHGWFSPESIRSWDDPDPIDSKSGLVLRGTGAETVKGMSPMMLCGLALAGANRPENALGHAPGLLTADEISSLDLSNCELAVLSACDTARGEMRRVSQGVASLQKALQIAGARSVITSLWSVPDEATKELMLDFYRRLWVEAKPKWQALWEAKLKLRTATDGGGGPKYSTRDWAAWVLTGEPE